MSLHNATPDATHIAPSVVSDSAVCWQQSTELEVWGDTFVKVSP